MAFFRNKWFSLCWHFLTKSGVLLSLLLWFLLCFRSFIFLNTILGCLTMILSWSGISQKQCQEFARFSISVSPFGKCFIIEFMPILWREWVESELVLSSNNSSYLAVLSRFWRTAQGQLQCFPLSIQKAWKCSDFGVLWILMWRSSFHMILKVFREAMINRKARILINHT